MNYMDQDIEILIGKWVSGNILPIEESKLMDWADSAPGNRNQLEEAKRIWQNSQNLKARNVPDVDAAWADFKTRVDPAKRKYPLLPMAAVFAAMVCMAFLLNYFMDEPASVTPLAVKPINVDTISAPKKEDVVYERRDPVLKPLASAPSKKQGHIAITAGDSALVFTLPDNSRVYLNKNSKLIYPERFESGNRIVHLSGEGFFEVTKGKGQFEVICQDTRTRVLGTSFNVKGYQPNNTVEVTVITGLVEVTNLLGKSDGNQLLLKPGEQGSFNAASNSAVKAKNVKKDKWWKKSSFRSRIKQFFNKITKKNNS